MSKKPLTDAVLSQFTAVFNTLRRIAGSMPESEWRRAETDFLVPARLAFHMLQAIDFHLDDDPDHFDSSAHGFDWETCPVDELPDQGCLLTYLDRVEVKTRNWAVSLGEDGLLGPDPHLQQWFPGSLAHAIYVLRHTQYHLGQLDALLHLRSLRAGEWM